MWKTFRQSAWIWSDQNVANAVNATNIFQRNKFESIPNDFIIILNQIHLAAQHWIQRLLIAAACGNFYWLFPGEEIMKIFLVLHQRIASVNQSKFPD